MSTIEQRLQALEDIEAIKRVKYDYLFFSDQKQPEKMRECFAEGEITIDYGRIGVFKTRDELVAVFSRLACAEHIIEMHHAQNPRVDLHSDDRASAVFGLYYFLIDTRQNTVTQLGGYYEDAFIKVKGEWKICATAFKVTSTQLMDVGEGMAKILFAGGAAPADIDDPSKQAG
jgi:hypothetical protein